MDMTGVTLQVLPDYQLKLRFANGSEALINMSHRLRAIRFGRLSSPELFASARLADGEVVWESGSCCVRGVHQRAAGHDADELILEGNV